MRQISFSIETFFWNLFNRIQLTDFIDILIIAFLLYKVFRLTQQTRAGQVFKGFLLLVVIGWLSNLLGFQALNWLVGNIISNGAIVLLILFQPELRRALEQMGRGARLAHLTENMDESSRIVYEITQCLLGLSRRRVGALIVFEQKTGLKDYIDTGTTIDSLISGPLIINIFEPNTPLHDGAVIIRGDRILAAACVLGLSEQSNLSRDLGTRHRAGLGVTETTDALVLIVSEETGIISSAQAGRLTRHLDAEGIARVLSGLYGQQGIRLAQIIATIKQKFSKRRDGGLEQ